MLNNASNNVSAIAQNNSAYLRRPHIHDLLERSLQKPVTMIVAGAGYGKTQAVYNFLQEYDAVTIWLQHSTFDNLVTRLWDNHIYTISLQSKQLSESLKSLGFPDTTEKYIRYLVMLSNEIKRDGRKYIFVYDDFYLIHEKHILQFYERLIDAHIPNLSMVFISRNEPDINIVGLLSKGLLSSISEDDLRFSKDEMIYYFQMQDIQLSPKTITDIYNYTDGWIFAINLAGIHLKKGSVHENFALSATKENIFRLMDSEIFSVISEELQNFLIKISLIEHLPLDLLKELSSDNPELISEIAKLCSFIRYDAFLNTYRIHQLFLSFLIEKQDTLSTEDKVEIYKKSAKWYADNGYNSDAITYYQKIEHYDEMLDIILIYYGNCLKDMAQFILDALNKIPPELYMKKPILQVIYVKFLLTCYKFDEANEEGLKLAKKYEALPHIEENNTILGEVYIVLGLINFFHSLTTGEYLFTEFFRLADKYLPNGSTMIDNTFLLNRGNYSCAVSRPIKGEFDRCTDAICYAMPYVSKVMNGSGYGSEYLNLAEKYYFQKDLKNARKYAYQAIYKSQEQNQYDVECLALFYLVKIDVSKGDYLSIVGSLDKLRALVEKYDSSLCYRILDITEGWLYSVIGDLHKVAVWIRDDSGFSPNKFGFDQLVRARCYLAEDKYYELLAFLEKQEEEYGIDVFLLGAIEKKVIKAVALYQIKEKELSFKTLQEAYNLAYPDSLIMPFIEHGNNMRTLANAAIKDKECTIPDEWLKNISIKSSTYAKKRDHIIAEYKILNSSEDTMMPDLSKRELELLTDLCHGLTREEIAVNRDLSVNTVKSMLQNIYAKLGAANIIDAVRIATMMNLVD